MKVLFIGGSGIISSACTNLAIKKGIELFHLNRGQSKSKRPIPEGVKEIHADVRNFEETSQKLKGLKFDAVVDWISFVPEHLETNLELFSGKTTQYLLISSASAYQTPPQSLPVTEDTPLGNPFWQYSRDKIACENYLKENAVKHKMIYTIVRPSHTYDKTLLPIEGGFTVLNRMLKGKPIVIHGDGTSIWTLTHHRDFAVGLVGLLGNAKAMDETFHITSDEWLSWNQIYDLLAKEFKIELKKVYIPSEIIAKYHTETGYSLLGDKAHSMIFDNSKIKSTVPDFGCKIKFRDGVHEIGAWYRDNMESMSINKELDAAFDQMIKVYSK